VFWFLEQAILRLMTERTPSSSVFPIMLWSKLISVGIIYPTGSKKCSFEDSFCKKHSFEHMHLKLAEIITTEKFWGCRHEVSNFEVLKYRVTKVSGLRTGIEVFIVRNSHFGIECG